MSTFPKTLLEVAAEIEAAESDIKKEILEAARRGDCARVIHIVSKWANGPAAEVLAGLDPCCQSEVSQDPAGREEAAG